MTKEKLKSVFLRYQALCLVKNPNCVPVQMDDANTKYFRLGIKKYIVSNHLLFMCVEGQKLVDEEKVEKAMRWLGFLQGVLWANSWFCLDELKNHSRPVKND
jgi:hypothetical protein